MRLQAIIVVVAILGSLGLLWATGPAPELKSLNFRFSIVEESDGLVCEVWHRDNQDRSVLMSCQKLVDLASTR
jgi:hypothetical protein